MANDSDVLIPPNNNDAEQGVLGSLLIDPSSIARVRELLKPEDFYRETHRMIYKAIVSLDDNNEPVDMITLSDALEKLEQLSEIGGEAYLLGLLTSVPTALHDINYARIVAESAERRRMIVAARQIANLAYDESVEIVTAIDQAQNAAFALGMGYQESQTRHIRLPAGELLDLVETRHKEGGDLIGIPTGFTDLDRLLSGLHDAELIIIAGRPGMGKSALLGSMAMLASMKYKLHTALFSLEMKDVTWVLRMAAGLCKMESNRIARGDLHEMEWPRFYEAIGKLSESMLFIDDTPSLTPSQLRSKCRRLDQQHGLDVVFVDYLQLMQTSRNYNSRVHQVSSITKALKALSMELDIPVVTAAQLSRACEQRQDKRPQLSDLRDSGNIEEDADVVMFIYRDEYYNPDSSERPNIAEINVAKNRNGPTAIVDLYWNSQVTKFYNLKRTEITL
jgi:replicative DNA helicase